MQSGSFRPLKLSVIIVSYNVKFYLEQCLLSVMRALQGMEAEVIVIDNHSRDGSIEYLSERFPSVVFMSNSHNLGFAKANNKAIRQSQGEYVLLLNPDTIVGEEVLQACVDFMDTHPQAGGVGVRMQKIEGSDALESRRGVPTPITSFYKMVGFTKHFPHHRRFAKYYMGHLSWDEPAQIEIVSGAFCFLRRTALQEIGLLDEDFFMYGEDIDLSYRLLKAGWQNWYLPLRILHYKGESTQKSSFRYVHVFYEAMLIFFRKHYGNLHLLLTLPIQVGIYVKASIALCSTLMVKARRSLGFVSVRRQADPLYHFHVAPEHEGQCRQLVRKHALRSLFDSHDTTPPKEADAAGNDLTYLVYDSSLFTFHEILEFMAARQQDNVRIAIFNPANNTIITDAEILQ